MPDQAAAVAVAAAVAAALDALVLAMQQPVHFQAKKTAVLRFDGDQGSMDQKYQAGHQQVWARDLELTVRGSAAA